MNPSVMRPLPNNLIRFIQLYIFKYVFLNYSEYLLYLDSRMTKLLLKNWEVDKLQRELYFCLLKMDNVIDDMQHSVT